eukprot:7678735-Lingulodinium_polyedra.AAC.1
MELRARASATPTAPTGARGPEARICPATFCRPYTGWPRDVGICVRGQTGGLKSTGSRRRPGNCCR